MLDAAGSRGIQQTHHRTQLSPSAKMVLLAIKHISEEAKKCYPAAVRERDDKQI